MRINNERGFTLVEILVVVIVIGILAAIAIPTFLSQRAQAQDAQAKSTVRNAATALVSYNVEKGFFPIGNPDSVNEMRDIEPTIKWLRSSGSPATNLDTAAMVGEMPFERYLDNNPKGVVFGTRSASGKCFYMKIDQNGTRYGSDTQCEDPYETSNAGRITSNGW